MFPCRSPSKTLVPACAPMTVVMPLMASVADVPQVGPLVKPTVPVVIFAVTPQRLAEKSAVLLEPVPVKE